MTDRGGLERLAWVVTAYLLAPTVAIRLYGKLAGLYGRGPYGLGGLSYPWWSPQTIGLGVLAAAGTGGFVLAERLARELVPPRAA